MHKEIMVMLSIKDLRKVGIGFILQVPVVIT